MATFLEDDDLLLTTTPARPPLKLGEMEMTSDDEERYGHASLTQSPR